MNAFMRTCCKFAFILLVLAAPLTFTDEATGQGGYNVEYYVDGSLGGTGGDGISGWGAPSMRKLQTAIAAADVYLDIPQNAGHRVLIRVRGKPGAAAVKYYPDELDNDNRSLSFNMRDGVDILGGYVGTVEDPDSRDPCTYFSILSGDLMQNDGTPFNGYSDNSYTIVKAENLTGITPATLEVLDGFIIRGANNDLGNGGGVYATNSDFKIANCEIRDNQALAGLAAGLGGGIYAGNGSDVRIDNCIFTGNLSDKGGAIKVQSSIALIARCTIDNNDSNASAGALGLDDSTVTIVNCYIRGNEAQVNGGALECFDSGGSVEVVTLTNCLLQGNSAEVKGGALFIANADVDINVCTLAGNMAGDVGGAWSSFVNHQNVQLSILNSILWDNEAGSGFAHQIIHENSDQGDLRVAHSDVQGGQADVAGDGDLDWASSNIDVNPEFRSSINFRLRPTSACIDHSGAESLPLDVADLDEDMNLTETLPRDLDVDLRVIGSAVDMGAYEYQPGACPADCGGVADCVINVTDLLELLCQWGEPPQGSGSCDIDEDNEVDVSDLLALLAEWGNCAACGGTGGGGVICRTVSECMAQHAKPEDQYACICGGCLSGQITEGCPPECLPGSGP
jgi:hypothetical protein